MQKDCISRAIADIRGSEEYPRLCGFVSFRQADKGVLVTAKISGLPQTEHNVFAFHVHSGDSCGGTDKEPFPLSDGHYNPDKSPHPDHRGDLPPLFSCRGIAYMSVLTDRFTVREIVGRTIIIHIRPDDFMSQPAGNSGKKIACGKILPCH